ncbi:choice-of-anchor Q domain-containing protein [Sneathiella aquimaris]|uniref:choice-of-anchor Q domain-containing protein n=1 Tax=Sneathiella aquimaris TaxID=2599305 RepID=UPI003CCD8B27
MFLQQFRCCAFKKNNRLTPGNRAIDAGYPFPEVTEDFFGNPRPSGKGVDVGAVEYQQ